MSELVELPQGQLAINIFEPSEYRGDAILIHGFTGSKEDFDYIGPLLAEHGYRTFALDNRGIHESPHSKDSSTYSMQAYAHDAIDIARHFQLSSPHLFGHSYGGAVAQRAVIAQSELFASLTLFCSGPHARENLGLSKVILERQPGKTMQESWDEFAGVLYVGHKREALMRKRWLANDPLSILEQAKDLSTFTSVIPALAATKIPTHVLYGESDDAWPLAMQNQMAADLSAPVTVIKEAGHCPNEDQPEATADAIAAFWASVKS
jgi:pimeloyl-ACP methyl ester carboxylesterase